MFGLQPFELLVIAVIAVLVIGPDKLPKFAADAAKVLRGMRRMAAQARAEVDRELRPALDEMGLKEHLADLGVDDVRDLHPRRFASKAIFGDGGGDGSDPTGLRSELDDVRDAVNGDRARRRANGSADPGGGSAATPYDADAT